MRATWPWKRNPSGKRSWDLARDETMRLRPGRRGVMLRVEHGLVLVTQEGDRDDHVLEQGQELRLSAPGVVAAWAIAAARVVARDGAAEEALPVASGVLAS